MRPGMADVEGERRLIEVAPFHFDAGRVAAQRLPPVGADHEPRRKRFSIAGHNGNMPVIGVNRLRLVIKAAQTGKLAGALFQRGQQRPVVDVEAELLEADFLGNKADLGCTN